TPASGHVFSWPDQGQKSNPDEAERIPLTEGVSRLWYAIAFSLLAICMLAVLAVQGRLNCLNFPLLCSISYRPPDDAQAPGRAFFRSVILFSLTMLCLL